MNWLRVQIWLTCLARGVLEMAGPGGVDDTIVNRLQFPAQQQQPDALTTVGKFAGIQNTLNQNRLFQQTFAAKQRAGEILAGSDPSDPESGIRGLMSDPLTAPFAGEIINNIRGAQKTLLDIQGEQQGQAQSGLAAFMKSLPAVAADPTQWKGIVNANMATLSPTARARVAPAIESLRQSLTDDLPDDPVQAKAVFNNRLGGLMTAGGVTPEGIKAIYGTPTTVDTGGGIHPGLQLPPQLGGGFAPSGAPLGKTLAPQIITPELGPEGVPTPTVVGGEGSSNPLAVGGTPGAKTGDLGLAGPSQSQKTYNAGVGVKASDLQDEMATNARGIPIASRKLDAMVDALGGFQSGGWADLRSGVGQFMQGLKNAGASFVTQDMIDKVANSSLSDSQIFNAQIKPFVISALKDSAQGTGRVMRSEVDQFLQMADASKDPVALMKVLNLAKQSMAVNLDQAIEFPEFKQLLARKDPSVAGLNMVDFPAWYAKNNPGTDVSPIPPGKIKGTSGAAAGATHKWVPGKGVVPIEGSSQ